MKSIYFSFYLSIYDITMYIDEIYLSFSKSPYILFPFYHFSLYIVPVKTS